MARRRSPNYPAIGLQDAITRVRKIESEQGQTPEPREVVVKHMGFGSLNGSALKALSALLKYGLLEDAADGIRVSDRAVSILFPESEAEKAQGIVEAAFAYPLFAEIRDRWEGRCPSDESLKAFLIRRHFSDGAIDSVIGSYKETFELVAPSLRAYDSTSPKEAEEEEEVHATETKAAPPTPLPAPEHGAVIPGAPKEPFEVVIGERIKGWFNFGDQADVDDLISVLNAIKRRLPASVEDDHELDGKPERSA